MIDIDVLIKEAMLLKQTIQLNTYKNIKAEIQKNQTAKGAKPLTDDSQIQIIYRYAKILKDSISEFQKAGREDLVVEYTNELNVVEKLLPKPVTHQELIEFVESDGEFFDPYYVTEFYDSDDGSTEYSHMEIQIPKKDMGKAIKYMKSKFPTADGQLIANVVKMYLV